MYYKLYGTSLLIISTHLLYSIRFICTTASYFNRVAIFISKSVILSCSYQILKRKISCLTWKEQWLESMNLLTILFIDHCMLVTVDRNKSMLGTFAPQKDAYIETLDEETTPSGILARGIYTAKLRVSFVFHHM